MTPRPLHPPALFTSQPSVSLSNSTYLASVFLSFAPPPYSYTQNCFPFFSPHPTPAPTLDLPNKVTDGSGDHADDDEDCHHTHSLNTVHPLRPQPPLRTIFAFNLAFKSELLNDMFGGGYYYGRLPFYRSEIFVSFVCIYKSMSSVAILFSISNFLLA